MATTFLKRASSAAFVCLLLQSPGQALAGPLAAPGDARLRHDLEWLNDSGVIEIPLTAWPVSLGDAHYALEGVALAGLDEDDRRVYERLRQSLGEQLEIGSTRFVFAVSGAIEPRIIRSFDDTPRDEAELKASIDWTGERFAVSLAAAYVANPVDGDTLRPDGSYLGVALGNWILTAGWQERWFGPGRDGSLILSSNARPTPGIALQRNVSSAFESRWLRWIGPWSMTSFMSRLDDDRTIEDALLFGFRVSFRPLRGLEIGFMRTAQWCGDGRQCDLSAFGDLLIGNDNRGVNVTAEDEPGNQLAGFDARWSGPRGLPVAAYLQWIGEDGRGGNGRIGSWMRQVGLEVHGSFGEMSHRTHFELTDSMCREGGYGFSGKKPDCAYKHGIYRSGYRYRNRALGYAADGDGLSYSIGSTLVQSAGHTWIATLRFMEINREGAPDSRHTLSPTPQDLIDIELSHERETRFGRFRGGIGYAVLEDIASGRRDTDVAAHLRWSTK